MFRRVWVIISVLLDTGLRIEEALTLRREGVDLDNLVLRIQGKGNKERLVPISYELRRILFGWLKRQEGPLVFSTRNGTRMTHRNALRDLKALAIKLGIAGPRISFHTFRHTFALNYIRNGGSVFHLQRILGHTTLAMTMRYVSLQTADLQAVHERFSLLATAGR